MTFQLEESSYDQAWRVISAMQTDDTFNDFLIIVRMSCHIDKATIRDSIKKYCYPDTDIKKLKAPWRYLLLPRPNCFCLYDIGLKNIHDLAQSCWLFLQFEILFIDRDAEYNLKQLIAPENSLYSAFEKIKTQVNQYFFCQFDTDNPHFESDVSKVTDYNFVPDYLKLYFP